MKKFFRAQILQPVLLCLWLIFIFGNSLRTGDASNEQSIQTLHSLEDFFALFQISVLLEHGLLRQMAHFAEFFLLGALTVWGVLLFRKEQRIYLLFGVLFCIGASVIDETIQYFVPGRAMSFVDMTLDTLGGICGFFGTLLFWKLFLHIQQKRKRT